MNKKIDNHKNNFNNQNNLKNMNNSDNSSTITNDTMNKNISLYDSLTKENQKLNLEQNIAMYVCGPTVSNTVHIGNARTSVVYDSLFRFLKFNVNSKYTITYIRNITDIDDKIIQAAKKDNKSIKQLTEENIKFYHDNLKYLNCLEPTYEPKVSETIPEIIELINILIDKGFAYTNEKKDVYFNITKYPEYYDLSNRSQEKNLTNTREIVQANKKSKEDFALWKNNAANDTYGFNSPWGFGRPGWHIECSAMSNKYAKHLHIHGGGLDLLFPHHTNEKAQSCTAFDKRRYTDIWMHTGLITVNNTKMSKSLNNFITVQQLQEKGIPGDILRLLLLSNHYRKPLDYSEKRLEEISKTYTTFKNFYIKNELEKVATSSQSAIKIILNSQSNKILSKNFNIPILTARIIQIIKSKNYALENLLETKYCFDILGLTFADLTF